MADENHMPKRVLTPEEKAHKVAIQRAYMQRKIANETAEERVARLARSRVYSKAWADRDPEHARALGSAKGKRAYAADPGKFREINAAARAKSGAEWNANRREKRASDPVYAETLREAVRAWSAKHKDEKRQYNAAYWAANADRLKEDNRRWREANPDRVVENSLRWREANPERVAANLKAWREANSDYGRNRYQMNAEFKLTCCLRARLVSAVNRQRGKKAAKTEELIGCSVAFLRQHLEAQFTPEMTWENYGTFWHVDHEMPCATFDLTDPAQQRECFHYANLRPLTAVDNLARPRHPRHYKRPA